MNDSGIPRIPADVMKFLCQIAIRPHVPIGTPLSPKTAPHLSFSLRLISRAVKDFRERNNSDCDQKMDSPFSPDSFTQGWNKKCVWSGITHATNSS
jgi:hypothetical protein